MTRVARDNTVYDHRLVVLPEVDTVTDLSPGDFAEQGLVTLGRGTVFVTGRARLADEAGEQR